MMSRVRCFFDSIATRRDEIYAEFSRLFGEEHSASKTRTFINAFSEKTHEEIDLPVSRKQFERLQYLAQLYVELDVTDEEWDEINSQGNLTLEDRRELSNFSLL